MSQAQRIKIKKNSKKYVWDEPYLWRFFEYHVMKHYVSPNEHASILNFCHSYARGVHFSVK